MTIKKSIALMSIVSLALLVLAALPAAAQDEAMNAKTEAQQNAEELAKIKQELKELEHKVRTGERKDALDLGARHQFRHANDRLDATLGRRISHAAPVVSG